MAVAAAAYVGVRAAAAVDFVGRGDNANACAAVDKFIIAVIHFAYGVVFP